MGTMVEQTAQLSGCPLAANWQEMRSHHPVYPSQGYEPQESVAFGELCHGLSVQKISVPSQPPRRRGPGELEEAKEQESCDWALNIEARELTNS